MTALKSAIHDGISGPGAGLLIPRPPVGTVREGAPPGEDASARAAGMAYRARREREKMFGAGLFAGPAWDILLYLYLAAHGGRAVAVTEACWAASVPASTGLRHVQRLVDRKLVVRTATRRTVAPVCST